MKINIRCPYCGSKAILRDSSHVYGNKARKGEQLYVCLHYPACDAYVGVIPGTSKPKGTLANDRLRKKRILAHRTFDSIWKNGIMNRKNAYKWLADKFCMDSSQAHIGKFDDYMCDSLVSESEKVLRNNHIPLKTAV